MRTNQIVCMTNVYNQSGLCLQQVKFKVCNAVEATSKWHIANLMQRATESITCVDRTCLETSVRELMAMSAQNSFLTMSKPTTAKRWGFKYPVHILQSSICHGKNTVLTRGHMLAYSNGNAFKLGLPVQTAVMKCDGFMLECTAVNTPTENVCLLSDGSAYHNVDTRQALVATDHPDCKISAAASHRDTRLQTLKHFRETTQRMHLNFDTTKKKFHVNDVFLQWQCGINEKCHVAMFYFK